MSNPAMPDPRQVVVSRLQQDLGQVEAIDIRTAVLCGEIGCDDQTVKYVEQHPHLRCPYQGRVDDPHHYCMQLRREYQAAVRASGNRS